MPGRATDSGKSLVPFSPQVSDPIVYQLHHGFPSPPSRLSICWHRGNSLRVSFFRQPSSPESGKGEASQGFGGKVVELKVCTEDGELDEAQRRRIYYSSAPVFALLQSNRSLLGAEKTMGQSHRFEWWQHVLEFSKHISALLVSSSDSPTTVIENPKTLLKSSEEPTCLKAAWELMEIFYVDKQSIFWPPEHLVDWLADYDSLFSRTDMTVHLKLVSLQKKLVNLQVIEDDPEYWEGIALALTVGWLDIAVKLLRLHGSYQLDQLNDRKIENGLVEAVAVLVSNMPRMRPELPAGRLGICYKSKPDFVYAWEKWRGQVAKLDCSGFWVECEHHQTTAGLKNLLQIMLGNNENITAATCYWMELYIAHFLYIRPFTLTLDSMHSLALKCIQMKPISHSHSLTGLILGILGDNTEVVLAECSRAFGPWMVAHAMELLTAKNPQAEVLLHEECYNLGGISIEELYRLVYAQVLSSHALTWQMAPVYLSSCPKHGLGLLEILLYKQPVRHHRMLLKNLEICHIYELGNISSIIMKIAGIHHWKHGRKGSGVLWLQQARDEVRLSRIAQQLFDFVGKSFTDDSFKQWEGLIELLGSENGSAGGLEFLHRYRDFKKSLHEIQDEKATDVAQRAVEALVLLMKNPSTPKRFWLPLLHDSLKLLNWRDRPLLNASETNLFLGKLQELSMAKLHPDFHYADLPPQTLSSVRLALATNLGRAMLQE